jgi:hypothetical protein
VGTPTSRLTNIGRTWVRVITKILIDTLAGGTGKTPILTFAATATATVGTTAAAQALRFAEGLTTAVLTDFVARTEATLVTAPVGATFLAGAVLVTARNAKSAGARLAGSTAAATSTTTVITALFGATRRRTETLAVIALLVPLAIAGR